jgi:hypothetical protein
MIISTSIKINAPLATVWDVFTDINNWQEWNPVCRECRLEEGDAMACGACFSFELNPLILSLRIKAVIEQFEPGKKVVWSGSRLGINATHSFTFNENKGHVVVKSEESFSGPLLFLARLIGVPSRLHQLSDRLLESIKKQAESRK